ncbi:Regulator of nonsense transcripts 1 [Caenorhabditis elegans]|uniref:Regulator of nonsense transcripts 1 n=1 Tax=Caenorhabditis elegans TaxID=6239 RepID=UPI000016401D|nr:Regulator of nonsense transcripts 1 [Caenorhabditis elegans]CCD73461.1 Regulator of nonsense transcripts 1 [Caenorhabditis elegans]|eukprot:NP_490829.1 Regulator of nonsense transcripts 1 [Caenorhabditis elegans]
MDDSDDEYSRSHGETLTFVDPEDDGVSIGNTQDSQFAYEQFSVPTQSSQATDLLPGGTDGTTNDLPFHDVEDDESDSEKSLTEEQQQQKLPEHACRYCGISDPLCVAKCTVCRKWFCNSNDGTSGGHIVHHMVRSQHKEAYTHKDSPCGDTQLECYRCGSKNVFNLGFIPGKKDQVVVIICRTPCASIAFQNDDNWSPEDWKSVIAEKQLLSWIVNVPSEEQVARARKITATQAVRMEELWRDHPEATVDDLNKPGLDREPDHVQLRYVDAHHYSKVFRPLVAIEAEYDRRVKESASQAVGTVRWEQGLRQSVLAFFHLPQFADGVMKLAKGDELRLKHSQTVDGSEWTKIGSVFKIPDNHGDEVGIEIRGAVDKSVMESRIMFTVDVVWNATTFERQYKALAALLNDSKAISPYLYQKLLGHPAEEMMLKFDLPRRLSVAGLPELNSSQMQAVKQVLTRPLSLIQGPPGTGKTVVSATIVYHLVQKTEGNVLVCSPSNIAVDHLAEKIHKTGLKVVRLCARSREHSETTVPYLTLQHQLKVMGGAELQKLIQLKDEAGELEFKDDLRYMQLKRVKEHELLAAADVICCTCSSAADARLSKIRTRTVLIDESTQATEPEILVSIMRGVRQLVLVGDHCQLGPVVICKKAAIAGLSQSLFERLVLLGIRPFRLQVQYRMHPVLSEFPSNVFYDGSLQNGVTENDRHMTGVDWHWPKPNKPAFFWHCSGSEELSASGTSFLNRTEAANVEKLVSKLIKAGVQPHQIGVITPYEGQRSFIVNYMHTQGTLNSKLYENVEIASVDAFQGREKDYIIVTCVRSNDILGIGFLSDPRRLNVAITRAKYGLVLVGNAKVLARHDLWHELINHYKSKEMLYEGPINALKPLNLALPKATIRTKNNIAGNANRFGIKRMQYTFNEYKSNDPSQPRLPPTYSNSQNLLSMSKLAQTFNKNVPIPAHMMDPNVYAAARNQKDRRRGDQRRPPPQAEAAMDLSQGMMSQQSQQYPPQGASSQSQYLLDGASSLSGWSQSQTTTTTTRHHHHRQNRNSQQQMSQDMDDIQQKMDDLLFSQDC